MTLTRETAEGVGRCLSRCFADVQAVDPWRWLCEPSDNALRRVVVSMRDDFLQLVCDVGADGMEADRGEKALFTNDRLSGGVGLVLDRQRRPQLRADLTILDGSWLADRMERVLAGFREGLFAFSTGDTGESGVAGLDSAKCDSALAELLGQSRWDWNERGPGEYSAQLDTNGAPPVTIRAARNGVVFGIEMARMDRAAPASRRALAFFLLTTCGQMRLVHACATRTGQRETLQLQVGLPALPAVEEIDHALGALSLAHRLSAREARFLLDEAASRSYLQARNLCSHHQSCEGKEN